MQPFPRPRKKYDRFEYDLDHQEVMNDNKEVARVHHHLALGLNKLVLVNLYVGVCTAV